LKSALGAQVVALADADTVSRVTGAQVGFAGPVGLRRGTRVVADRSIDGIRGAAAGANCDDEHLSGGEICPRCSDGTYGAYRGIEVGHVFYLGTKYSAALGATVLDAEGRALPI